MKEAPVTGRVVPARWIGEQHVREDLGLIPSLPIGRTRSGRSPGWAAVRDWGTNLKQARRQYSKLFPGPIEFLTAYGVTKIAKGLLTAAPTCNRHVIW